MCVGWCAGCCGRQCAFPVTHPDGCICLCIYGLEHPLPAGKATTCSRPFFVLFTLQHPGHTTTHIKNQTLPPKKTPNTAARLCLLLLRHLLRCSLLLPTTSSPSCRHRLLLLLLLPPVLVSSPASSPAAAAVLPLPAAPSTSA